MNIALISGSQRPNSNTHKVAVLAEAHLQALGHQTLLLDLSTTPLPMWDDSVWQESSPLNLTWRPHAKALAACDGFVILTPEWHGMVPSALKNFFLFCSPNELGHKAALIIAVSAGMGGSYPVAELRMSSYKNARLCYIPEHLILRQVESFLADYDSKALPTTQVLKERLAYNLALLLQYSAALGQVRASGVVDHKHYPNGM